MTALETYLEIDRKLQAINTLPDIPANVIEDLFDQVERHRNKLKSMDHKEIGITPDELEGAIMIAEDTMRRIMRAKRVRR